MKSIYSMTEAESEVMEKLWDQEESIKQSTGPVLHYLKKTERNGKGRHSIPFCQGWRRRVL